VVVTTGATRGAKLQANRHQQQSDNASNAELRSILSNWEAVRSWSLRIRIFTN